MPICKPKGIQCSFAPHAVRGGRKLQEQIHEAVRIYDRLLLILADVSMSSEWVKTEIARSGNQRVGTMPGWTTLG
jgi:ribonuclease HI